LGGKPAADEKSYDTQHYNLAAVIAVGYKVNSERAVQFRKWATAIVESFAIKGFEMADERLKNHGSQRHRGRSDIATFTSSDTTAPA
jgi:hypothetical protein